MYAMPREKKYRLDSRRDVIAAIGLFGMHCGKYPISRRQSAARHIAREARRRGIKVSDHSAVGRYSRRVR